MDTFVNIFGLFQYAQMHFLIARLVIISTDVTYARRDLKLTVTTHAALQVLHVSQSIRLWASRPYRAPPPRMIESGFIFFVWVSSATKNFSSKQKCIL